MSGTNDTAYVSLSSFHSSAYVLLIRCNDIKGVKHEEWISGTLIPSPLRLAYLSTNKSLMLCPSITWHFLEDEPMVGNEANNLKGTGP